MEIPGQRLLVIETITWKPHIETAMEIALCAQENGQEVHYLNLRKGLPIVEDMLWVHALLDLPRQRIDRAQRILAQHGIALVGNEFPHELIARHLKKAEYMLAGCSSLNDVCRISLDDFPDIGWGVASSAISMMRDPFLSPDTHRNLLARLLVASMLVFDKAVESIDEIRPDSVILFNGRFATTRAALRAAEKCRVPWYAHERGCDKNHYWVVNKQIHNPNYFQQYIKEFWNPSLTQAGHDF
jgi:hypothetical protein